MGESLKAELITNSAEYRWKRELRKGFKKIRKSRTFNQNEITLKVSLHGIRSVQINDAKSFVYFTDQSAGNEGKYFHGLKATPSLSLRIAKNILFEGRKTSASLGGGI